MAQCMNALADKVHKQELPCMHTDMHFITWPDYSTTILTYVAVNLVPTGMPLLLM